MNKQLFSIEFITDQQTKKLHVIYLRDSNVFDELVIIDEETDPKGFKRRNKLRGRSKKPVYREKFLEFMEVLKGKMNDIII